MIKQYFGKFSRQEWQARHTHATALPLSSNRTFLKLGLASVLMMSIFVLSFTVLIGWFIENRSLVQIIPSYAAMQFNTAVAFTLTALALLAFLLRWPRIGEVVLGAMLLLVSLTFMQRLTGLDLGVDQMFVTPFTAIKVMHPGRMSLPTNLGFLVLGAVIMVRMLRPDIYAQRAKVFQGAIVAVGAVSALSLLGYAVMPALFKLMPVLTGMAIHTAFSFLVLSVSAYLAMTEVAGALLSRLQRRILVQTAILLVAFGLSAGLYISLTEKQSDNMKREFAGLVEVQADQLVDIMQANLTVVGAVESFYNASVSVSREEFRTFANDQLQSHSGITSLEWVPKVSQAGAAQYMEQAQAQGIENFRITEQTEQGESVPAADRPVYYPIMYAEPGDVLQGYDMGSDPVRLETMEAARDSGAATISPPLQLTYEDGVSTFGALIFNPIYSRANLTTVEERQQYLSGFAVGSIRLDQVIAQSMGEEIKGAAYIYFYYMGDPARKVLVYASQEGDIPDDFGRFQISNQVSFQNHVWEVIAYPNQQFFVSRMSTLPFMVFGISGLVSVLLAVFLANLLEQNDRISLMVEDRTREMQNVLDGSVRTSIIATDNNGVITVFNRGAENLLGYDAEELVGKKTLDALHLDGEINERSRDLSKKYHKIIRGFDVLVEEAQRGRVEEREWTYVRKGGEHIMVSLTVSPIRSNDQINGFLGVAIDITERKEAERMKNEFVSVVSHELRTPLTSIQGSLGLLRSGVEESNPEMAKQLLDISYTNCERLVRLINGVLDLQKIEAGQMVFNFEAVEIVPLVEEIVEQNRAFGERYRVNFVLENQLHAPRMVRVDVDRMNQAITNLLSNASKFSPRDGHVDVVLHEDSESHSILIDVRDHGPGIEDNFKDRIFDKFAQADSSSKRKISGTGLGLNITKTIIEEFSGEVSFTSVEGEGTTFTIRVPIFDTADEKEHSSA